MGADEAGLIRGRGWGCVEVEDVSVEGGEHGGRDKRSLFLGLD